MQTRQTRPRPRINVTRSRRDKNCDGFFFLLSLVLAAIMFVFDILRIILYKIPVTLYRCCCKTSVDRLNIPPTKCVLFNGYTYTTAHVHDVDGPVVVEDCEERVHLGLYFEAGFEIAPGDANDVAVTSAHPWGSGALLFADKHSFVFTSLGKNPGVLPHS